MNTHYLIIRALNNGYANNISLPKRLGDAGYDVRAAELKIKGTKINGDTGEFSYNLDDLWSKIDYIEYNTKVCLEVQDLCWDHGEYVSSTEEALEKDRFSASVDYYFDAVPCSRNRKYNLLLANSEGTIDALYRGEILISYKYVIQPEDLVIVDNKIYTKITNIYNVGDVVGQLKMRKNESLITEFDHEKESDNIEYIPVIIADKLTPSERGVGGHGSTEKIK